VGRHLPEERDPAGAVTFARAPRESAPASRRAAWRARTCTSFPSNDAAKGIASVEVADGLIGNGTRMYSTATAITGGHPFYSAPEANPTTRTKMQGLSFKQGGSHLAYDPDHHILYLSNYQGGLSHVVVE
jgi:hypothetical protein